MHFLKMEEMDLNNKRVLIRVDLNVPIEKGHITNCARLEAIIPTLQLALKKQASIILISHLGRPKEGQYDENYSLKSVAEKLSQLIHRPIRFEKNWLNGVQVSKGEIVLCENVRFEIGEESNNPELAKRMAALCDVFVMDAFASAHRAHASTVGVAKLAAIAVAGPLLTAEIKALDLALKSPKRPLIAIVGGAKVSSKLRVLQSLLNLVDVLIVGGGIANTLLAANGKKIGGSLYEPALLSQAEALENAAKKQGVKLIMPIDAIVASEISDKAKIRVSDLTDIQTTEKILDVGPETVKFYNQFLQTAGTVLWNGPIGVFEVDIFGAGTKALAIAIVESKAFSIAGGGETLAAIDKYGVKQKISYISTGGGAFLEYVEGKKLPAIIVLEERK